MGKDPFDKFMSNYSESTPSLNSVVDDTPAVEAKKVASKKPSAPKQNDDITVAQRQALAEARNVKRGRPVSGAEKKEKKIRIGFEIDPKIAEDFKMISYRTGIPFGQLYEEAMTDLISKYK